VFLVHFSVDFLLGFGGIHYDWRLNTVVFTYCTVSLSCYATHECFSCKILAFSYFRSR